MSNGNCRRSVIDEVNLLVERRTGVRKADDGVAAGKTPPFFTARAEDDTTV